MYGYPKHSRWKQLQRCSALETLYNEHHPDKILFYTLEHDCIDKSDTVPFAVDLVTPKIELAFDRLHIDKTTATIYLLNNNGSGQIAFYFVSEIYYKNDISGNPIVRIRCKFQEVQKSYCFALLKGEIYK